MFVNKLVVDALVFENFRAAELLVCARTTAVRTAEPTMLRRSTRKRTHSDDDDERDASQYDGAESDQEVAVIKPNNAWAVRPVGGGASASAAAASSASSARPTRRSSSGVGGQTECAICSRMIDRAALEKHALTCWEQMAAEYEAKERDKAGGHKSPATAAAAASPASPAAAHRPTAAATPSFSSAAAAATPRRSGSNARLAAPASASASAPRGSPVNLLSPSPSPPPVPPPCRATAAQRAALHSPVAAAAAGRSSSRSISSAAAAATVAASSASAAVASSTSPDADDPDDIDMTSPAVPSFASLSPFPVDAVSSSSAAAAAASPNARLLSPPSSRVSFRSPPPSSAQIAPLDSPLSAASASAYSSMHRTPSQVQQAAEGIADQYEFDSTADKIAELLERAMQACQCGGNGGAGAAQEHERPCMADDEEQKDGQEDLDSSFVAAAAAASSSFAAASSPCSSSSAAAAGASPCSSSSSAAAASMSPHQLLAEVALHLRTLRSSYHSSRAHLVVHLGSLRDQISRQSEEFVRVRLHLEKTLQSKSHEKDEELSRIRIEEMVARERETEQLRRKQEQQETEWLKEKLRHEEEKAAEISALKAEAESVSAKLEQMSSNTQAMMDGEAKAIETGEGELKRMELFPSDTFGQCSAQTPAGGHVVSDECMALIPCGLCVDLALSLLRCTGGHTQAEFHFRLAESQFLRMAGGGGGMGAYHVTKVEFLLNPPLLKRYHGPQKPRTALHHTDAQRHAALDGTQGRSMQHSGTPRLSPRSACAAVATTPLSDFKWAAEKAGEKISERLTFHGTTMAAIEKIILEGFRIGGVDTPVLAGAALGTGIYSSESPAFAMGYIKDGRKCLLFSRVCPTKDSVIQKGPMGEIQQLVCKHREQVYPQVLTTRTSTHTSERLRIKGRRSCCT